MAKNGCKTAIYQLQIFVNSLLLGKPWQNIFKCLYEYEKLKYRDVYNISNFKAFGMINLQYEIGICQKYIIE